MSFIEAKFFCSAKWVIVTDGKYIDRQTYVLPWIIKKCIEN